MKTYMSHDGSPMMVINFEKLGRMLRAKIGLSPTRAKYLGIRVARLIVANQVLLAQTVLAIAGFPAHYAGRPMPWPEPERLAILGAIAYANRQWLAGLAPATFGVQTDAERGADFQAMSETCGARVVLALIRRPGNALNVEPIQPMSRCRQRTPPEWGDVDPRGARWLASGGDAMILGICGRARCPRMT